MEQKVQALSASPDEDRLAAVGLDAGTVAAFRAAAQLCAPELALRHAALLAAAYAREGAVVLPPRWRTRWPNPGRLAWSSARRLACDGLGELDPRLGERARKLMMLGRIKRTAPDGAQTREVRFGPPRVSFQFDGGSESAVILAHELGHAVQMTHPSLMTSRPPPRLAPAELAAMCAERGFHIAYGRAAPSAAQMRIADDMLAMLVRHPARDALEQVASKPRVNITAAWKRIAAQYAPGHNWAVDPPPLTERAAETPLGTAAYAIAAAVALPLFERIRVDGRARARLHDWYCAGPQATLEDAMGIVGARSGESGFFERAYEIAMRDMPPS